MPLWNKLKQELDRAGHAAQEAIDDGRERLDAFRARQLADKAAQALGYAVYRARQKGTELDADTYSRLASTIAAHEADEARAKGEGGKQEAESRKQKAESRRQRAANRLGGEGEGEGEGRKQKAVNGS